MQLVEETPTDFVIGDLEKTDIENLIPVFRQWVRRQGEVIEPEVRSIVDMLRSDLDVRDEKIYLVARDSGCRAVGVMGCGEVNPRMAGYRSAPDVRAAGLVAAFVSVDSRGKGLGKSLLLALFERAGRSGWSEMIWSSNPRYRETAWKFYTDIAGDPVGMIADFFEPGSNSPVWRMPLCTVVTSRL
jgi:L-amino acid N-acyltransferase YncA